MAENRALPTRVSFLPVFSAMGARFVRVSVRVLVTCRLFIAVLFLLTTMVATRVSGVRLFEVLIEFRVGTIGIMLCVSTVLTRVTTLYCIFEVLCLRSSSPSVTTSCAVGLGTGLFIL